MGLIKLFNRKLDKIFPIILVIVCFFMTMTRIPFYDEARAFVFSSFSINELLQITRIEGHQLTWYLLLKPLSKFIKLYPYTMLLLNWLISTMLVFFFWKKAPFSNIFKSLILLSYPFLCYYLIVVRPYSLTILFLFILTYYLKDCTKKPIFYSFLLFICMNSTVIGAIGAFGFFLIFIKKLFKENFSKKNLIISTLILILGGLFLLFQFANPQLPDKVESMNILIKNHLFYFFICPFKNMFDKPIVHSIFQISSFILFYFTLFLFFKYKKDSLIFIISTYILLSLTFLYVYCGGCWHHFFYFVFYLISLWISWDEIKKIKIYKYFLTTFLFFAMFPIFYTSNKEISVLKETQNYSPILKRILSDKELKNSKLFCFEKNSYITPGLLPYLKKHNIYLYDMQGEKWGSFNSYMKTYSKKTVNDDKIRNFVIHLDKEKNNYLLVNNLSTTNIPKTIIIDNNKYKINLEMVDLIKESIFAIYKINLEVAEQ